MKQKSNVFKEIVSIFCIIVGSLALSLFYLTSWANSLIFDTNYYLDVVTPLSKNEKVAKALSTYTTDIFFTDANVEERIRNALPEQAKFLASTLADELQNRSYTRTSQIIGSDPFSSVWVAANTLFHKRILAIVRGQGLLPQLQNKEFLQGTSFEFDGSQLAQSIKNQLGSDSQIVTDEQIQKFRSIAIPAYNKLENIRAIVYWISQFSAMLLPASLALILFGIAIAFSRQKALLTTGIFIIIFMIVTLLTIQIIKSDVLQQITQPVYQEAATVVWDSFLKGLKQSLWVTILVGLILIAIALLFGPYTRAKNFQKSINTSQFQKSTFMRTVTRIRTTLARYAIWLYLVGILVAVVALFIINPLQIATVVIVLSSLLIYIALLLLIFPQQTIPSK